VRVISFGFSGFARAPELLVPVYLLSKVRVFSTAGRFEFKVLRFSQPKCS